MWRMCGGCDYSRLLQRCVKWWQAYIGVIRELIGRISVHTESFYASACAYELRYGYGACRGLVGGE